MPIVGEAIVRVRVVGDRVGPDIARAVRQGVRDAEGDLDASGERAGTRWSNALNQGVRRGAAGRREEGDRAGNDINEGIRRRVDRDRPTLANLFGKSGRAMMSNFKDEFNLGIGAARMGPAILSALAVAAPSMLSGFASMGAALASSLVTQIAAAGPFVAGALGVVAAAASTALLNFGLLYAAIKSGGKEMDDAVTRFKGLAKSIGEPIAQGLLPGFNSLIDSLQGGLGQLQPILQETGAAFGRVAKSIGETITRADNMNRIQSILSTNKTFIDNFGVGMSGLTSSFLILFNAAKPFIDMIGEAIAKFGTWAEATLSAKEANGELATFMTNLVDAFKTGAKAIGDFIVGLYNVLKAAAPVGGGFVELAAKFREWTGNPENQERMTRFFEKMSVLTGALVGLFAGLAAAAGGALEKMDLGPILTIFDILANKVGPALADLWNQVQSGAGANLVKVFDNLGTALQKIVDSGAFEKIAQFASGFLVVLSDLAASDFGSTVLAWTIPLLLFGGTISSIGSTLFTLGSAIAGLGAAVLAPVAAIAAGFALMWANSETFRTAIMGLVADVQSRFGPVWEELQPKLEKAWDAISRLAGVIGDFLAPVIERIGPLIGAAFEFIVTVIGDAISIIGDMINIFVAFFTGDWSALWEGVKTLLADAWTLITDLVGRGLEVIWNLILSAGALIATIWTALWNGISAVAVGIWTAIWGFIQMAGEWIADSIRTFGNNLQVWWDTFWNWVGNLIVTVWTAIWNFIVQAGQWIYDTIVNFGNNLQGWWNTFWAWVGQLIVTVWNAIWNFIVATGQNIYDGIVSFGNQLQTWWDEFWAMIGRLAEEAWDSISETASRLWNAIIDAIEGIVEPIVGWLQERWDDITSAVSTAWDGLEGIVSGIWEGIKSAIIDPIQGAYDKISELVGWIGGLISGILDTVGSAFTTVNSNIASMQASAETASAIKATTSADVATQISGIGTLTPSKIERSFGDLLRGAHLEVPFGGALAKGGTVPAVAGGQLFQLGEAGRRERVEPLDSQGLSTRDRALIAMIVKSMLPTKTGSGGTAVSVRIGERELTDVVTEVSAARDDALARRARLRRP